MKRFSFFNSRNSLSILASVCIGLAVSSCGPNVDPIDPVDTDGVINAHITASRTLTDRNPNGVDYTVKGEISIKNSAIVTVEPGVTIQFEQDAAFIMEDFGALKAVGTAAKPITFTGKQATKGFWKGLIYVGSNNTDNQLSFCTIEYGGGDIYLYDEGNVVIGSDDYGAARVAINNSTIRNSSKSGIYLAGNSFLDNFTTNTITGNDGSPMSVDARASDMITATNDYSGNGENYVMIIGNPFGSNWITKDILWEKLNVPYGIKDDINMRKTLTIAAGTEVVGLSEAGFYVDGEGANLGKLVVAGTASNRIKMRGLQSTKGFWKGIFLWGGEANLSYCDIDYAGGYSAFDGGVGSAAIVAESYYEHVSSLTVTSCTVNNSNHWGIIVDTDPDAGSGGVGSTFTNNGVTYSGNVDGNYKTY